MTDIRHIPTDPRSVVNKLTHVAEAKRVGNLDQIELVGGGVLFVAEDRIRIVRNCQAREVRFSDIPEFDTDIYHVAEMPDGDERFKHIRAYGSDQTGGMVMVDWLEHRAGVLLTLAEESLLLWRCTYARYEASEQQDREYGVWLEDLSLLT